MSRRPQMVGALVLVARALCCPPGAAASPPAPAHALLCVEGADSSALAKGGRTDDELTANGAFQRAMGDLQRLGIATGFCELRKDTLTLDLGEGAFQTASAEYNLSRAYSAYLGLTEYGPEVALELRYGNRLVGWYTSGGLVWLEKPTPPPPAPPAVQRARTVDPPVLDEAARSGLHLNAGVGAGSFDRQCQGCDFEADLGLSGFLSLGRWLGRKTVLGAEGTGWTKEEFDRQVRVYSAMVQVTRYASASSNLFVRAGAGLVGYSDDFDLTAVGPGFSGRVGYEIGVGKAHVVPYLGYVRSFDGVDMKRDGDDIDFNFAISQLQLGLGVSIH